MPVPLKRFIVADPHVPPSDYVVSALLVATMGGHDCVQVYSRGGHAGMLTMTAGDAKQLAATFGLVEADE